MSVQRMLEIINAVYQWKYEELINRYIDIVIFDINHSMLYTLLKDLGFDKQNKTLEKYAVTMNTASKKNIFKFSKI